MKDDDEIEVQLISELEEIHRRVAELQALETQHRRAEKTLLKAQTRLKNQLQKQAQELMRTRDSLLAEQVDREQAEELASLLVAAGRTSITAVKASIDAICAWSPDDVKLMFCNRAFLERWQIKDDYHDMYTSDCFEDDSVSSIIKQVTEATISGGWFGELTGKTTDGQTFPVLVNTSPILNKEGTVVGLLGIFKDITELKRAEEEKRLLSSAVEQSIDGIAIADLELKLTYVNAAYARMHGYSPREMIGMKAADLHRDEHLDEYKRNVERLRSKGYWCGEIGHVRKDGQTFPAYVTVTRLKDEAGNPRCFVTVARDTTERKQAEKQLRESEAFNAGLLDNAPNPILVVNPDASIRYVNPAFGRLTGFSAEEVIDLKPPYPWWRKGTFKKTAGILKKAMHHGQDKLELPFQKKNGEELWVEITSIPVFSEGEYKYYLSNWVDVTDRKRVEGELQRAYDELEIRVQERTKELAKANAQLWDEFAERKFAEEALEDSERKFRNILSSLPDLFFVFDSEGRFTYCHPEIRTKLYLPLSGFIGKKHSEVMPPDVDRLFADAFSQNRRGEIAEYKYQLDIDGKLKMFSAKLSPMFLDGEFSGSVAVIRDINL